MLNSFSQSLQNNSLRKARVFKYACWYKGIASHQPRKEGRREEGRREIEEGERKGKGWKGKEDKRGEKKKMLTFYFESPTKSKIYNYFTDLNIGAKTKKLHKKTRVNIHDKNFSKNSYMKPKAQAIKL